MKRISKTLICLIILFSGIGARFFAINTPVGNMSIFRMMLLVTVLFTLLKTGYQHKTQLFYKDNRAVVIIGGIWFSYALITVVWVRNSAAWSQSIFFLFEYLALLFVVHNHVVTKNDVLYYLKIFNVGGLIQAVIGSYECVTGNYLFKSITTENDILYYVILRKRVPLAFCWSENEFATLMFFSSTISLFFFLSEKRLRHRVFYLFCSILYGVLIIFTTSRAVLVGLVILYTVVLLMYGYRKWGVAIIISPFLVLSPLVQGLIKRFLAFDFVTGNNSESIRISLIKNGLFFLAKTFGLGVGAGQSSYWLENYAIYNVSGIYNLHNWWIEILSEYGIIIFLLYIFSYCRMFNTFFGRRKETDYVNRVFSRVVCGYLCGFVFASISSSTIFKNEAMWTFFALLTIAMHIMRSNSVELSNDQRKGIRL